MKNNVSLLQKLIFSLCVLFSITSIATEKLKFIADVNFPTGEKFKETELGGLSGIYFDAYKNKILAVSDDRGSLNDFRFYELDFKLDEKSFSISPSQVIFLKDKEGKSFKKDSLDCEGIALLNNQIIISTEGWIGRTPVINPTLLVFNREGVQLSELEVPAKFLPQKNMDSKIGARDNLVFEGLSSSIDQNQLMIGTEEALFQDDRTSTPTYNSTIRILLYKDLKPFKEFAYVLEKVPSISVAGLTVGETGLSELLMIDNKTFYSIERSYLPLAKKTIVRIFKNTIADDTTDISGMETLKKAKFKTVDKELVVNLEEFLPQLHKDFQTIDNIEGITFGPKLKNGHNTLILVSDNNFNKKQRTQFLAFEILP